MAGVAWGSALGPILHRLYTTNLPQSEETTMVTLADDSAILAVGEGVEESTEKLQRAFDKDNNWTRKWLLKLNEAKSVHVDFSNKMAKSYVTQRAKYLGMKLDAKLRWKAHVEKKKTRRAWTKKKMYWLLGRRSALSIHNKLLMYKEILKPVLTYGLQRWGYKKPERH
jgi:hypothetical protein